MRTILVAVLLALPVLAQTDKPAQSTFYGGGVLLQAQTSPKPSGFGVVAKQLSVKAPVWSFTETDISLVQNKLQTSVRTGVATSCSLAALPLQLYCLADTGVASTGANTGSAFAGGVEALIPLSKPYKVLVGYRAIKTAISGMQQTVNVGIGWGGK